MLVELAIGAVDNEDAYAFVEKLVKCESKFKILKKVRVSLLIMELNCSLSDGNENANHTSSIEKLLETVKGIKKKEGRKGKKRLKRLGWEASKEEYKKLQQRVILEKD